MHLHSMKCVSIIVDQHYAEPLTLALRKLNIKGFTFHTVYGEGEHGVRTDDSHGNVKIEVITDIDTADDILHLLRSTEFSHAPLIMYVADVKTYRHGKFVAG